MSAAPARPYQRLPFERERCTRCGDCLHRCPVMHYSADRARTEWGRLLAGEESPVLRRCTSCLACNLYCPHDCRPANLILDRWHEAYLREGLPARAAHFLPHARPNFRTGILDRLPADEQQAIARWRQNRPAREFLYAGCNLLTTPYLTFSRLFAGLEIRGGLDYCCGEMLFRMGLYETVEQVALRLSRWFRLLGAQRVYLLCTACLNILRNVLPQFGADFAGIEFLPYYEVILDGLKAGTYGTIEPLRLDVTMQDSCHARVVEPGFAELPRRILDVVGARTTEPPHSREDQLCCGIGGGFAHDSAYHPIDLLLSARSTSRDQRRIEAAATCVYCSGCLEMLSVARWIDPNLRPIWHLVELVQMSIGETPRRRQGSLARQFILGTIRHQFPRLVSRGRFWLPEVPPEPNPEEAR